jgi:branched-chain amino acid transport system substrate-binding protein
VSALDLPRRRRWAAVAAAAAVAVGVAACGSDDSDDTAATQAGTTASGGESSCAAKIGIQAPITGPVAQLGGEQLNFAQFAIDQYNEEHGTQFELVEGDTQLTPAQATTVIQQFISDDEILAVVGPAGSQEVSAIGPLAERADLALISGSATGADLTEGGKYPTFFRVVPRDDQQATDDAQYIIDELAPQKVMVVDDQSSYSTGLADAIVPELEAAGITVQRESVNQKQTDFSSLVSTVSDDTDLVFLPWQVATNSQRFGQNLAEQGKDAVIFATDGSYSPDQFSAKGAYVSSFAPDITAIPENKQLAADIEAEHGEFGTYGPPLYAAAMVAAEAIDRVCQSGEDLSRENVLEQIRQTDQPDSILGQPIKFDENGDLVDAQFAIFQIEDDGTYTAVPRS